MEIYLLSKEVNMQVTHNLILIALTLIPLVCFVFQSVREYPKANTLIKFFQYGDDLKASSFFATLTASSSGLSASIYIITVYGYFFGIGVFPWVLSFWVLTQLTSQVTIKRVEKVSKSFGGFLSKHGTLHEFLGLSFGSNSVRMAAATLSSICYLGIISCEILLGYEVVSAILPDSVELFGTRLQISTFLLTFFFAGLVFFYTCMSGFRAVIKTDLLQLSLLILMILSIWVFICLKGSVLAAEYENFYPTDISSALFNPTGEGPISFLFFFVFMNILFWAVWWPTAMDQWHRCAATAKAETALDNKFGTVGIYSILYFAVLTLTFLVVGSFIKILIAPTGGETAALYYFVDYIINDNSIALFVRLVFAGLVCAGLASAVISTIDSYLVVASQSIVSDIFIGLRYNKTLIEMDQNVSERSKILKVTRLTIVAIFILNIFSVIAISNLADLFTAIYSCFSLMLAILPVLIISLCNKSFYKSSVAAVSSLVAGGLWATMTNIYVIFKLEHFTQIGDLSQLTFYYNLLYANPTLTAVVAGLIYYCICVIEQGEVATNSNSSVFSGATN